MVASAWLGRSCSQPVGWRVCFASLRYTAMTAIAAETDSTGTSIERATRSAVRWRVPVSDGGMVALGMRWTLARAIREASAARMMAPSILASSERRWGLNSASSRNPPDADRQHIRPVPHHHQRAPLGLEDPVEAVTQGAARGRHGQSVTQLARRVHRRIVPFRRIVPGAGPVGSAGAGDGPGSVGRWSGVPLHSPPCSRRHTASATVSTRISSTPGGPSGRRGGDGHPVEPHRTASASRRGRLGTWRTSPARPTSPNATRSAGRARPVAAEARASATARSAAGSTTRMPPAAEAKTSTSARAARRARLEDGQRHRQAATVQADHRRRPGSGPWGPPAPAPRPPGSAGPAGRGGPHLRALRCSRSPSSSRPGSSTRSRP